MNNQNALQSLASESQLRQMQKRHRSNWRFVLYGKIAVAISVLFLIILMSSIIGKGYSAFWQHEIELQLSLDESIIDPKQTRDVDQIRRANFQKIINNAIIEYFPEESKNRRNRRMLFQMVSSGASSKVRQEVLENLDLIGTQQTFSLPLNSKFDMYLKGKFGTDEEIKQIDDVKRALKDIEIEWIHYLKQKDLFSSSFNGYFFTQGDSRNPEMAGIWGSMVGSILVILCCMVVAFPIGVMTAVYLEEFAPKNKLTDIIEVNLNNLAAVPSIVFGLLGLSVYLGFFGMPRSAALVGGITLALMVLPTIVITTRNSLRAVPSSIRDGALALGASPVQVIIHHTLPLAMPGIMTGTILSVARALGETAPLLMIGMVAFIADVPSGILDPATVMPVQIYLWSDIPEKGFAEKTSAGIMVLLGLLLCANALAVYLRKKFEIRW
ncbi:MAG: phosphate ABC transporter permease PstA [Rickettsiales bacterium]|nr:phosphate ABC transporter permease PstA [Rickettsiales bacterium]